MKTGGGDAEEGSGSSADDGRSVVVGSLAWSRRHRGPFR